MKTVKHLLNEKGSQIWSTTPDATVHAALKIMAEKDVGALLVFSGGKLAGIFSERDYARKVILYGKSSHDTLVKEIMTTTVTWVRPQQTVTECMAIMTRKHIRHLPVFEGDHPVGMISIRDVVEAIIVEQANALDRLERTALGLEFEQPE